MGAGGGLGLAAVLAAAVLCGPGALAGRVLSGWNCWLGRFMSNIRGRFFTREWLDTGTGSQGRWSQHQVQEELANTLGKVVGFLGMVLFRARSWT